MKLDFQELKRISDYVSERRGWDFSAVRAERAPVPWDYIEVVRRYLTPDYNVLDIGTGGGERFLRLADAFKNGTGVDPSPEMIKAANENKVALSANNVTFALMSAESLAFPDESFDVVLNRHATVDASEAVRVLRTGGYFITQQVGANNTRSICDIFGCGPGGEYETDPSQNLELLTASFQALGCQVVARAEYDVAYRFLDVESFIYWLKAIPMPNDFQIERHWREINRILETCATPAGIETNEHRQLLIARRV